MGLIKALLYALFQGLLQVASLVFFPAAWEQYEQGKNLRPGSFWWLWMNNDDPTGNYEESWSIVYPNWNLVNGPRNKWERFWCAYYFSGVRNFAWNWLSSELFERSKQPVSNLSGIGKLFKYDANGQLQRIEPGHVMTMKRFKFVNDTTGNSTNGTGSIDWGNSLVGWSFGDWKQNEKAYGLISIAMVIKRFKNGRVWAFEFNVGMASRWLIRIKFHNRR